MAPHSSTLAWKIPWAEEPGRLQSMGSLRVRHDWATLLSLFTFMHWRRFKQALILKPSWLDCQKDAVKSEPGREKVVWTGSSHYYYSLSG